MKFGDRLEVTTTSERAMLKFGIDECVAWVGIHDATGLRDALTNWILETEIKANRCSCGPQARPFGGLHAPVAPGTKCLRCLKPIGVAGS